MTTSEGVAQRGQKLDMSCKQCILPEKFPPPGGVTNKSSVLQLCKLWKITIPNHFLRNSGEILQGSSQGHPWFGKTEQEGETIQGNLSTSKAQGMETCTWSTTIRPGLKPKAKTDPELLMENYSNIINSCVLRVTLTIQFIHVVIINNHALYNSAGCDCD